MIDNLFQLGDPIEHRGVVIVPLFPRRDPVAPYITLDEALPQNFRIREASEAGLVPELFVENPLAQNVLLYDGEELVGAKQNRILNVTVLVGAGSTLPIPVSCVEEGRWQLRSAEFGASPYAAHPRLRRRKAEALQFQPLARGTAQGEVWDEVAMTADRLAVSSGTRANADAFRSRGASLARLEEEFPLLPGQCGAVLALGDALCLDALSRPEAFTHLWPKLRAGYLLDALDGLDRAVTPTERIAWIRRRGVRRRSDAAAIGGPGRGRAAPRSGRRRLGARARRRAAPVVGVHEWRGRSALIRHDRPAEQASLMYDQRGSGGARPAACEGHSSSMRPPSLVVHADWGINPDKRWLAQATREPNTGVYNVTGPSPVGPSAVLLERLLLEARRSPVLIGFDFPIGLPYRYAEVAGIQGFKEAVVEFGEGRWSDFYRVAETPAEVSITRPFYPRRAKQGVRQSALFNLVNASNIDELLRVCDRATPNRNAACCLFWTLGANQVGKGAISGWAEFVAPALHHEAVSLWPFDGSLSGLLATDGLVIAETYPREFYDHIRIKLTGSKREKEPRQETVAAVDQWLDEPDVAGQVKLSTETRTSLDDGFGSARSGEDAFDAFVGLLGMLNIVLGRRPERSSPDEQAARANVEGWIMGR